MWLFLSDSFLSIVDKAPNPEYLVVRARREDHIKKIFPSADVQRTPYNDYLFRAFILRAEVADAIQAEILGLDYPNFKASIKDARLARAAGQVWGVMAAMQEVSPFATKE